MSTADPRAPSWTSYPEAVQLVLRGVTARTAGPTALVVGTALTLVNQGGRLRSGTLDAVTIARIAVNFIIPFCVASIGFLGPLRERPGAGGKSPSAERVSASHLDRSGRDQVDNDLLVNTRRALHVVVEHLLATDLASRSGRIGLRALPNGFGQPELVAGQERRRLRIDGDRLVLLTGDAEQWFDLSTPATLAVATGSHLGAPEEIYTPETVLVPDATLEVDPVAALQIAEWFRLVGDALEVVRSAHAADRPTIVQLWPEHFDLACSLNEVNLGGSPGDDTHPEPYLYVGPWEQRPGDFWNEPWGASLGWRSVPDVATAVEFLERGLREAGSAG